ncbi:hypothetical protein [Vibrio tarriae]|uniref:hypothetical protein n=1 Tax=Vibrio tarriae TaxID=2014742 RepID=UPI000DE2A225|nr:hypothetical protein [Vibrio tarriae]QEO46713.1 hypothetical protein F0315_15990 [Vibrio cholerae]RBM25440.1 hypothetical protein DLR58_19615 [Vibrio tarriae]
MRPTYENVYISSFIFSLGYLFRHASKGDPTSVSIDLYQQVKSGERLIGDLLTSIGGKNIIVEFKRDSSGIPEEFKKKSKKDLRKLLDSDDEVEFQEISKKSHFLSYAERYDSGASTLAFCSYIDLYKNSKDRVVLGNKDFSSKYVDSSNSQIGVNEYEFKYYVDKLASSTGGTCGGMAISIDKDGIRSMVVFDDIKELSQSLKLAEERAEKLIQSKEPSSPSMGMCR